MTPSMHKRVQSIKKSIERLDRDDYDDADVHSVNRFGTGDDFSSRYGDKVNAGDISSSVNEKIVCCPCFYPLNSCWTAVLRSFGYGSK